MKAHVSVYVSQLPRALDFYTRFFGCEPLKVQPGYAKFELSDPAWVISLVEQPTRVQSGFGHLGLVVDTAEAVQQWMADVQARGLTIHAVETQARCCYALQDKFWVQDPDGLQWEVYAFHADSAWNDPVYEAGVVPPAPACCE